MQKEKEKEKEKRKQLKRLREGSKRDVRRVWNTRETTTTTTTTEADVSNETMAIFNLLLVCSPERANREALEKEFAGTRSSSKQKSGMQNSS